MNLDGRIEADIFDRDRLLELLSVLDLATVHRLLEMLEQNCGEFLEHFRAAIENGDESLARAQAHKLAGALSQYGLALARDFQALERSGLAAIASAFPHVSARLLRDLATLPDYVRSLAGASAPD